MKGVLFQRYVFDSTIHLAMIDAATGRALAVQSGAKREGVIRLFGTMRQSFYRFWRLWLLNGPGTSQKLKKLFLFEFETLCLLQNVTTLEGAVPERVWLKSYRHWTGFRDTGKKESSVYGPLVVIRKKL